jgi:RNA polymerase sigma factor FliA
LESTPLKTAFSGATVIDPCGHLSVEQEELLVAQLPMVRFVARRIHERLPQHVPIEDLFSAGILGLMDAFAKFDPSNRAQFKTYAQFRVRGAILDSLRCLDWSPRELRRKGRTVEQAIETMTVRLGRSPSETEIAQELGMSLPDYHQLLGDLQGLQIGSLHTEFAEDSGEEQLAYIPGRSEDDPLFRCLRGEMRQRVLDALGALPERERLVVTLYYYEEMTMKEIGTILGVVESRVSQLRSSAILRLRAKLRTMGTDLERRTASPNRVSTLPARLDPRKRAH